MSYFLSITGSPTKFSKSGFLLRNIGSILEEREIDFRAIHALDFQLSRVTNVYRSCTQSVCSRHNQRPIVEDGATGVGIVGR